MSDGTEVVGSIRLLTYALECIGRALRKKRVECTGGKLDFKAIVDEVHKTELNRAVERQQFYAFAEAASKTLGSKVKWRPTVLVITSGHYHIFATSRRSRQI